MPISKKNRTLLTLEDWEAHAPPKSPHHWVDGRSAKETARAWLEGRGELLPSEIAAALAAHPDFGPVFSWQAEPEARLRFDGFAGEPRNSDLAVLAQDRRGLYLIAVEAKADETFGETVADTLAAALDRSLENPRSNGVARVQQLARALFEPKRRGDPAVVALRYQLLTACAGALCEAERQGLSRAVMLIHEFVTDKTDDARHARNAQDLDAFVGRLSHCAEPALLAGEVVGPLTVPGAPLLAGRVDLYIAKAVRHLRTTSG